MGCNYISDTYQMEGWKKMEGWKDGRVEDGKGEKMEGWKVDQDFQDLIRIRGKTGRVEDGGVEEDGRAEEWDKMEDWDKMEGWKSGRLKSGRLEEKV